MESHISFVKYIRGNELVDDPENSEFKVMIIRASDQQYVSLDIKDKINGIKVGLWSNRYQGTCIKFVHKDKTEYNSVDCELIHKMYTIIDNQPMVELIKSIMKSSLQLNVVHDQYLDMFNSSLVTKMKRIDF